MVEKLDINNEVSFLNHLPSLLYLLNIRPSDNSHEEDNAALKGVCNRQTSSQTSWH